MIDRLEEMKGNDTWKQLSLEVGSKLIAEFGKTATSLLTACLSGRFLLLILRLLNFANVLRTAYAVRPMLSFETISHKQINSTPSLDSDHPYDGMLRKAGKQMISLYRVTCVFSIDMGQDTWRTILMFEGSCLASNFFRGHSSPCLHKWAVPDSARIDTVNYSFAFLQP